MRKTALIVLLLSIGCSPEKETSTPNQIPEGMVWVSGGTYTMGGNDALTKEDELPPHKVTISDFFMDEHEVTNAQFSEFVEATGYITTAERKPDWEELKKQLPPNTPKPPDSILVAGSVIFDKDFYAKGSPFWNWIPGANWKHPLGPNSGIDGKENHPVVHISWEDANEYAKWIGKRLPTEAEWEYAARGGSDAASNPRELAIAQANIWQGSFPYQNSESDGHFYTSPVKTFEPNALGIYDMSGNVWEWVADWYHPNYYSESDGTIDPTGPELSYDPLEPTVPKKVVRGGSFLCHDSYCAGYRPSARMRSSPDTGLLHTGFRLVKDYTPNNS